MLGGSKDSFVLQIPTIKNFKGVWHTNRHLHLPLVCSVASNQLSAAVFMTAAADGSSGEPDAYDVDQ